MKELTGNIWDFVGKTSIICITTNLENKLNGEGVMGAGLALEASKRYSVIPKVLGTANFKDITIPSPLMWITESRCVARPPGPWLMDTILYSQPVKAKGKVLQNEDEVREICLTRYRGKYNVGDYIPSWAQFANLDLIIAGAEHLQSLHYNSFVMGRPGCGFGGLDWANVQPELAKILDDRFTIVSF